MDNLRNRIMSAITRERIACRVGGNDLETYRKATAQYIQAHDVEDPKEFWGPMKEKEKRHLLSALRLYRRANRRAEKQNGN